MQAEKNVLEFRISSLMKLLIGLTVVLVVLSVVLSIYHYMFSNLGYIRFLFDLDSEWNIPTRFASELLVVAALLFFIVYRIKNKTKDKYRYHWFVLALIFLLMALDESVMLHEQTSQFLRGSFGNLYFAWVIPGAIFVLVFTIAYLKFFFSLESRWKKLFFFSAFIFVSGALGMEVIGNYYQAAAGQDNLTYAMLTNFEELLEFAGVVLLIYGLTTYLMHLNQCYLIELKK
jgi:hypothetical protein